MALIRRWKRRGQRLLDALTFADRDAKIFVKSITFSAGQTIALDDSSILVIVGPNNAGKSSTLREIRDHLRIGHAVGPVLKDAEIRVKGTIEAFKKAIVDAGLATSKEDVIRIDEYSEYQLSKVSEEITSGFIGSKVIPFFVSFLNSEERLRVAYPTKRGNYFRGAPKSPMQWLELDEGAEKRISDIFEQTFDASLVLNTLAGEDLVLHIAREEDVSRSASNTREEAKWFASLPRLHHQGDGMRSFA